MCRSSSLGGRRPKDPDPENIRRIREAWTKKPDSPIEIFENYPFTARNFYLPVFNPILLGEGINATKGISRGEDVWLSQDFSEKGGGLNHFMVYFTARMYWGGKDQDIRVLLEEYLERFYGPAAEPMGEFFAYCEEHWMVMDQDAVKAERALELFELAKQKAEPESVYGRRVAMVGNFLERLRLRLSVLSQKRGPVPSVRKVGGNSVTPGKTGASLLPVVSIVGQECPTYAFGGLFDADCLMPSTFKRLMKRRSFLGQYRSREDLQIWSTMRISTSS